jgi:hypothetical protein
MVCQTVRVTGLCGLGLSGALQDKNNKKTMIIFNRTNDILKYLYFSKDFLKNFPHCNLVITPVLWNMAIHNMHASFSWFIKTTLQFAARQFWDLPCPK